MAITLTLLPADAVIGIGKTQQFTATVAGAPDGATTVYAWDVDGTAQESTTNTLDYIPDSEGTKKIKVTATTSIQDSPDDVQTQTVDLVVNKNIMNVQISATAENASIKVGNSWKISCVVTGQPSGATVQYLWSTGETTADVTGIADTAVPIKRKCTVTVKADDYEDFVGDSNEVTIAVSLNTIDDLDGSISGPTEAIINQPFVLTAEGTSAVDGVTFSYAWLGGGDEASITKTEADVGSKTYSVTITASANGYEDAQITKTHQVLIKEQEIPDECPLVYVHPLPWRASAYIWAGWWVMDAIQKLTLEGKDWKTATKQDTPYYCHLAVLAKMLTDYPEVDVQESRNGYIVHRTALEAGIIYS